MRRARRQPPPDLTSLFDVLFIVIFAALIRAAAVQHAAEAKPPPPPSKPMDPNSLIARAGDKVLQRPIVIVRVAADGRITEPFTATLLQPDANPDIVLSYPQSLCGLVHQNNKGWDLSKFLVIIAPEKRLEELPHALVEGLTLDVHLCQDTYRALAVIVEP